MIPNTEIFIAEGDWRIAKFSYTLGSYLSVSDSPAWICIGCGNTPPKSILTVFILHNWDDACDEM